MNEEAFRTAVRTVWPGVDCRLKHNAFGVGEIDLEADTEWNYDQLTRLSSALGTTDLRFRWETDPGYSEYTPGGPDRVTIEVRWP